MDINHVKIYVREGIKLTQFYSENTKYGYRTQFPFIHKMF